MGQQELLNLKDGQQLLSAADVVTYSLSQTSKRQYAHTYRRWLDFCMERKIAPSALSPQHVIAFLESDDLSHRTKQARLTHLRKLLEAMHAQEPDNVLLESLYKQIRLLKVKRGGENASQHERTKHALRPAQAFQAFTVFSENSNLHTRNRALLAILV